MDQNLITNLLEDDIEEALLLMRKHAREKEVYKHKRNFDSKIEDNYTITHCKVCNAEFKISCLYNGGYPLCKLHRDPNERPETNKKIIKSKNNFQLSHVSNNSKHFNI